MDIAERFEDRKYVVASVENGWQVLREDFDGPSLKLVCFIPENIALPNIGHAEEIAYRICGSLQIMDEVAKRKRHEHEFYVKEGDELKFWWFNDHEQPRPSPVIVKGQLYKDKHDANHGATIYHVSRDSNDVSYTIDGGGTVYTNTRQEFLDNFERIKED